MKLIAMIGTAVLAGLLAVAPQSRGQDAGKPAPSQDSKPQESGTVHVLMKTSAGDITLELNREKAPISTDNFLRYADSGFYNGTIFHRVIPTFMIQGGGFTPDMELKKTEATIKNEWKNGLKNEAGTIAMARIGGQPDSASSQFFINVKNNANLDQPQPDGAAYAVFGKVVDGMDVVNKIKSGETKENPKMRNEKSLPLSPVVIQEVRRMKPEEVKALREKQEPKG